MNVPRLVLRDERNRVVWDVFTALPSSTHPAGVLDGGRRIGENGDRAGSHRSEAGFEVSEDGKELGIPIATTVLHTERIP